jgi:hypothetical protein
MVGDQRRGLINRLIKLIKSRPARTTEFDEKMKSANESITVAGRAGFSNFPSMQVYSKT